MTERESVATRPRTYRASRERVLLLRVHAQAVLGFDGDPTCRIVAPYGLVWRLPHLRTLVPLLLVGVVLDGEQDVRGVGIGFAFVGVPRRRPAPPGVGERHDVVYVYVLGIGVRIRRIRVEPGPRLDLAALSHDDVFAVPDQGRVSHVAGVVRRLPAKLFCVAPVLELLPGVARHGAGRGDGELLEGRPGRSGIVTPDTRVALRCRTRKVGPQRHDGEDQEQGGETGSSATTAPSAAHRPHPLPLRARTLPFKASASFAHRP